MTLVKYRSESSPHYSTGEIVGYTPSLRGTLTQVQSEGGRVHELPSNCVLKYKPLSDDDLIAWGKKELPRLLKALRYVYEYAWAGAGGTRSIDFKVDSRDTTDLTVILEGTSLSIQLDKLERRSIGAVHEVAGWKIYIEKTYLADMELESDIVEVGESQNVVEVAHTTFVEAFKERINIDSLKERIFPNPNEEFFG